MDRGQPRTLPRGSTAAYSSSTTGDATKFEVRIRLREKENFRPGMSVTAEIETRYRTNVLAVPMGAVAARMPKAGSGGTNTVSTTNSPLAKLDRKASKPREVVFVVDGDRVKQTPVRIGIGDENGWEIAEGLNEGQEIVTGGFKAVTHDLEDGRRIRKAAVGGGFEDKEKL